MQVFTVSASFLGSAIYAINRSFSCFISRTSIPSGKRLHSYGKSQCLIGKSTINGPCSIAMLNYQRVYPPFSYGFPMVFPWFSFLFQRFSQALVYVIDSSDRRRLEESGAELAELLAEERLAPSVHGADGSKHMKTTGIPLKNLANNEN